MNIYTSYLLSFFTGYIICNLHPAYILGKMVKNIDIRSEGSNNSGASNVTVVLGFKYGVLTAAIDILKGFLAVTLVRYIVGVDTMYLYLCAFGCILGHIYPILLKFSGGKGLASLLGITLAFDWRCGLILGIILISVTLLTQYIALGTIIVSICFFVFTFARFGMSFETLLAFVICAIMSFKHTSNIKRIIKGEEVKLFASFKKK